MILDMISTRNCFVTFSHYNFVDDPVYRKNCPKDNTMFIFSYNQPIDKLEIIVSFDEQVDIRGCFIETNQISEDELNEPLKNYYTQIMYSSDLSTWTEFPIRKMADTYYKFLYTKNGFPVWLKAFSYKDLFTDNNEVLIHDFSPSNIIIPEGKTENSIVEFLNNNTDKSRDYLIKVLKSDMSLRTTNNLTFINWVLDKLTFMAWSDIQVRIIDNKELESMVAFGEYVFMENNVYVFSKKVQYIKYVLHNLKLNDLNSLRVTKMEAWAEVNYNIPISLLSFRIDDYFPHKYYETTNFIPSITKTFFENLERNNINSIKYPNTLSLGINIE